MADLKRPAAKFETDDEFEALLAQHLPKALPRSKGEIVDATVVAVIGDSVLVTFGAKAECPIPATEFMDARGVIAAKPGDIVRVMMSGWDEDGAPELSYRKARAVEAFGMLAEAAKANVPVRGQITRALATGVLVDVAGASAFMPASQIDLARVPDLNALIGQEIEAYVIEYDAEKNRAVLSRRKLLSEHRDTARQSIFATLTSGATVQGTVRQVLNFGAFVSLGPKGEVDALLPRSELTYDRGVETATLVSVGQQIQVKIIEADAASGKITVSRKRLHEDPWAKIEEHYPVGTTVSGKISGVQTFGAFVHLQEGITGLLHNKDLSWSAEKKSAGDSLRVGDTVTCQVVEIDKEKKRLGLSLKHLTRDPWSDVEARFTVGSRHKATVTSIRDFGAFVKLDENVQALLHISDITWEKRTTSVSEELQEGQEIDVVVLELDSAKRRIRVGRKQTSESPYDRFISANKKGSKVKGTITRLVPFGAFVELAPGLEGLIHISELDDQRVDAPERVVRVGEEVYVKIMETDKGKQRIGLSRKEAIKDDEADNIKQYTQKESKTKGGSLLGDALSEAFKKAGQ